MQLTIDSSEPLAEVAAVVGALYGVELVVSDGSTPPAATSSSGRRRSRGAARTPAASRSSSRRSRKGQVDAKVVRQWAVDQGMTVSSRGQLSKAILEAYAANA